MCYQLNPLDGGRPISVDKSVVVVGRNPLRCDVPLEGDMVSPQHARLNWSDGTLTVVDLDSRSGTWLNGEQVTSAEVRSGDELAFGSCRFRVEFSTSRLQTTVDGVGEVREPTTRDEPTTIVSLTLLDQLLARESKIKVIDSPTLQPQTTPDEFVDVAPLLAETSTEVTVDSLPPTAVQTPIAADEDLMHKLLAEFDAAKIANAGMTPAEIVASKFTRLDSRACFGNSTDVQITDDDESPPLDDPAAPTPAQLNDTLPMSVDRPLWKTPARPDRQTHETLRPHFQRRAYAWGQKSKWTSSPTTLVVVAAVLLTGAWFWHGTGDGATIERCHRLRSQLVELRTQGKTSGPEWEAFRQQAVEELKVVAKALAQSVDASQPQRQALLFAIRDDLPLMLTKNTHWSRELPPEARQREELFDRHLKIALGQSSVKETAANSQSSTPPGK